MSNEILCLKCEGVTEFTFLSKNGCYLLKDIYDRWIKGCDYKNTPKRLKKVVDKLLIQSNLIKE